MSEITPKPTPNKAPTIKAPVPTTFNVVVPKPTTVDVAAPDPVSAIVVAVLAIPVDIAVPPPI